VRIIWLGIVAACALAAQTQTPKGLEDVHTIFVDSLGSSEGSGLIRDKLINRLSASKRFQVVLDADKADSIMTGSGVDSASGMYGAVHASAAVCLVTKDQKTLWVSAAKNSLFKGSASSSLADNIVKELEKAAAPPKPKK
jgi:hypothetical protein